MPTLVGTKFSRVAIVLGGAECWQRDLEAAQTLGVQLDFYVVNDQIANFPGEVVACTLHPERVSEWIEQRVARFLPAPSEIWTRTRSEQQLNLERLTANRLDAHEQAARPSLIAVNVMSEWGGTSGLFAFQVARARGHERIIFCGVPMDESPNSFRAPDCAIARYTKHQDVWKRNMAAIKPFARSMSGWTASVLGSPTLQWLQGESNDKTLTNSVSG